jgi:hypothetical protein
MLHEQERGRLIRWQRFLKSFNLRVHHLAGKSNSFADGLSRCPYLRALLASATAMLDPLPKDIVHCQTQEPFARKRMRDAQHPGVQTNW